MADPSNVAPQPRKDYYKVLVLGPSGDGKTNSFRNMNPKEFGFVNVENKPLPFQNNLIHESRPANRIEMNNAIVQYAKDPSIKAIGIDSFSAYTDMLMADARATKKGFDIFNFYNEELAKFFTLIKKIEKEVYLTAHYEILGIEGNLEKRAKVKGKEWEGVVEKEFTIVLVTQKKFNSAGKPEYFFNLAEEGTPAKCPPGIFGEDVYKIPNDLQKVQEAIVKFAK